MVRFIKQYLLIPVQINERKTFFYSNYICTKDLFNIKKRIRISLKKKQMYKLYFVPFSLNKLYVKTETKHNTIKIKKAFTYGSYKSSIEIYYSKATSNNCILKCDFWLMSAKYVLAYNLLKI